MKTLNTLKSAFVLTTLLSIAACAPGEDTPNNNSGNAGSTPAASITPASLNQAAYEGGVTYRYGHNSIPNIDFTNAPTDMDYSRWAMLHDGSTYRLYFFKAGSNNTLYQFGYNPSTQDYEYGYNSISQLTITGIPADADMSKFAMLHDGTTYRLYVRSATNVNVMYQFGYNTTSQNYEYGHNSIPSLNITLAPADVDHSKWAMLHDGSAYRLYLGKTGDDETMYQFAYNVSSSDYEYGYNSIDVLTIADMPADSIKTDFAMLHDGSAYRFYFHAP